MQNLNGPNHPAMTWHLRLMFKTIVALMVIAFFVAWVMVMGTNETTY